MFSARATARMRASGPTSTGTMRPRFAASIGPSSESRSHGCTIAHVMGGSPSHCLNSFANPSLRRRMNCGVATSEYAMCSVGAWTIATPSTSLSPC